MDIKPKQYRESKTMSKVEKEKKSETSEQRVKRYAPFNLLKTLFVGGLLATAGMGGIDGRQLPETESRLREQKNVTQSEFDLGRVPPGFPDYLRKVGASESLIRKVERQNVRQQRQLAEQKLGRRLQAIPGNRQCLDVSGSLVSGSLIPDPEGLPGQVVEALVTPSATNNCGEQVDAVSFHLKYDVTCPSDPSKVDQRKQDVDANPSNIAAGDNAQVLQSIKNYGRCLHSDDGGVTFVSIPPGTFTVTISAGGLRDSDETPAFSLESQIPVNW